MGVAVDTGTGIQQVSLLQLGMLIGTPTDVNAIRLTPSLTSTSSALAAPVTMTSATQYYDGPSVTLAPGTWLLMGDVELNASATNHTFTAKLWDGTNAAISSGQAVSQANVGLYQINLPSVVVTPTVATTYKISAKSSGTGDSISASGPGEGNTASILTAIRIA